MPQAQFLDIPNWGQALGQFGSSALEGYQEATQEDALQKLMSEIKGMEPEDALRTIFGAPKVPFKQKQTMAEFTEKAAARVELKKQKQKEKEEKLQKDVGPLKGALDIVNRMRDIRSQGRLGIASRGTQFLPGTGSDVRRDRGVYSQLGKSLISHATNIPIRNRLEFETLGQRLYDPNITDAEAEGILDAMELIINNSLSAYEKKDDSGEKEKSKQKNRPDLSTFLR